MFLTIRRRIRRLEVLVDRLYPPEQEQEENEFFGMSDEEVDAVLHRQAVAVQAQTTDPDKLALCQALIDRIEEKTRYRATWRPEWRAYVERKTREANSRTCPAHYVNLEHADLPALTEK